jgi:hypothetical protein
MHNYILTLENDSKKEKNGLISFKNKNASQSPVIKKDFF